MITSPLRSTLIGLLAALAAGVTVSGAAAALDADVPSVRVKFADLALDTPQGTIALYRRLDAAARVVCHTYEQRSAVNSLAWSACVNDALGRAVAKIDNPRLNAYYLEVAAGHAAAGARRADDALNLASRAAH